MQVYICLQDTDRHSLPFQPNHLVVSAQYFDSVFYKDEVKSRQPGRAVAKGTRIK
jgi:hypothetical protein